MSKKKTTSSKRKSKNKKGKNKSKSNIKRKFLHGSSNSKKKNKKSKIKMDSTPKSKTARVEYNNGYAVLESMSITGHRLKKGSFKKRANGEYRQNRL